MKWRWIGHVGIWEFGAGGKYSSSNQQSVHTGSNFSHHALWKPFILENQTINPRFWWDQVVSKARCRIWLGFLSVPADSHDLLNLNTSETVITITLSVVFPGKLPALTPNEAAGWRIHIWKTYPPLLLSYSKESWHRFLKAPISTSRKVSITQHSP
jgi:hypothetical protein